MTPRSSKNRPSTTRTTPMTARMTTRSSGGI
jgi:hypothetical protein